MEGFVKGSELRVEVVIEKVAGWFVKGKDAAEDAANVEDATEGLFRRGFGLARGRSRI